jgi:peptidyl-prolyl cis-trans isomerase B (cyclophilin B)
MLPTGLVFTDREFREFVNILWIGFEKFTMRFKIHQTLIAFLFIGSLLLSGCSAVTNASERASGMNDLPKLEGKATVVMTVNGSPITIEVDGTNAPISAGNFVDLVQRGVYDGVAFHRVIGPQSNPPENPFVAQGGDPQSKDPKVPPQALGSGSFVDPKTGKARYVPLEIKAKGASEPTYSKTIKEAPELPHKRGAIAMARSQAPDSASAQFYFALADLQFLDGSYAVFGKVTSGMDEVVDKIKQGDRVESAKVTEGAENLKNGGN